MWWSLEFVYMLGHSLSCIIEYLMTFSWVIEAMSNKYLWSFHEAINKHLQIGEINHNLGCIGTKFSSHIISSVCHSKQSFAYLSTSFHAAGYNALMFRANAVTSVLSSESRPIHLAVPMTWRSCLPDSKCFNVLLNMLWFTESQWWIFVFPMLWKESEVINLDIQLDRIDRCHGLVKNSSECFQEAISREYWHVRYQWREKELPWKWLYQLRVLMWREWDITILDREESILAWTRLSSPLRNFLHSLQITVLCLSVVGGLLPLKLWIKIKPSSLQLPCSGSHGRHTTLGLLSPAKSDKKLRLT